VKPSAKTLAAGYGAGGASCQWGIPRASAPDRAFLGRGSRSIGVVRDYLECVAEVLATAQPWVGSFRRVDSNELNALVPKERDTLDTLGDPSREDLQRRFGGLTIGIILLSGNPSARSVSGSSLSGHTRVQG
jgi:hypothetical protein